MTNLLGLLLSFGFLTVYLVERERGERQRGRGNNIYCLVPYGTA